MAFKVDPLAFGEFNNNTQQNYGGLEPIEERTYDVPERQVSPEDEQGIIADFIDKFQQGAWGAAADIVTGARGLLTDDAVWEMEQALRNRVSAQEDTLSTAQKEADANFSMFGTGDKEFTGRGFGGALFQGAGSLIPSVGAGILSGGAGAVASKALGMGAKAGQVAGGAAIGAPMIGGGSMNQVREELDTMPEEQFTTLPDFDLYYQTAIQQNPDDPINAMKIAREIYTQDAEQTAVKQGAALGSVTMGAAVPMLDKVVKGGAGFVGGVKRGAGTEFLQEGAESGGQEAVVNPIVGRERWEGVPEAAGTGAILGGIIGGAAGGIGGLRSPNDNTVEPVALPSPTDVTPVDYTPTPLIKGGPQPVADTRRDRPAAPIDDAQEQIDRADQREIPLSELDNDPVLIRQALNEGLVDVNEAEQALDIIAKTPAPAEQPAEPDFIPKPSKSILQMDANELAEYRNQVEDAEYNIINVGNPDADLPAINEIKRRIDTLQKRAKKPVDLIKGKKPTPLEERRAKRGVKPEPAVKEKSPAEKLQDHGEVEPAHAKAYLATGMDDRDTMTPEEVYNRESKRTIDDYTKQMDQASTDRDKVDAMSTGISQEIDMYVDDNSITKEDAAKLEQAVDDNLFKYAGDLLGKFRAKNPKKYEKFLPAAPEKKEEAFNIDEEVKQLETAREKEAKKKPVTIEKGTPGKKGDLVNIGDTSVQEILDPVMKDGFVKIKTVKTRDKNGDWQDYKGRARKVSKGEFIRLTGIYPAGEEVTTKEVPIETKLVDKPEKDEQGRTDAQKEAGNYKKIHKSWNGLDIAIENAEGTKRTGTDEDGKAWETTMRNDYGYIKRTTGADGDHVDVFMGPNLTSDKVYVVNQTNKDGSFDEHKVMVGFNSAAAAEKGYLANYQPGWDQYENIAETNVDGFKTWLKEDTQKKPAIFDVKEPVKTTYGQKNKVFTPDAAAAARELLKKKLSQLSSGVDPEIMQAGLTLAGYHIEAGARTFGDFTKAMVNDLGDGIKPYLKSFYESVRYYPGFDNKGMSTPAEIEAGEVSEDSTTPTTVKELKVLPVPNGVSLSGLRKIPKQEYVGTFKYEVNARFGSRFTVTGKADTVQEAKNNAIRASINKMEQFGIPVEYGKPVESVNKFDNVKNNRDLRKLTENGTDLELKGIQEEYETYIVKNAMNIVDGKGTRKEKFNKLVDLYNNQINMDVRTSTSKEMQAYSTPAPLAYIASLSSYITKTTRVYEPTAGNGMLLIGTHPRMVKANELDPNRAKNLESLGYEVSTENAVNNILLTPIERVIANPPFGNVQGEKKIDHLITLKALEQMTDKGRASIIIGANKQPGISVTERKFFNELYSKYNVTDIFEVSGKLYSRSGAAWPVRVITINGKLGKNDKKFTTPKSEDIKRLDSWEQIYERFQSNDRTIGREITTADPRSLFGKQRDTVQPDSGRGTAKQDRQGTETRAGRGTDTGTTITGKPGSTGTGRTGTDSGRTIDGQRKLKPTDKPATRATSTGIEGVTPSTGKPKSGRRDSVDNQSEYQSNYPVSSKGFNEAVLTPNNMLEPLKKSLKKLKKEVGDLDTYVTDKLQYDSIEAMHKAFMGLQVDAVAAAIYNIDNGNKGIIIADQTGVGKGRQAAAILRYAKLSGKTPVFVTVGDNLFSDMYADLQEIDETGIKPFIFNDKSVITHKKKVVQKAHTGPKRTQALKDMIDGKGLPDGHNAIFTTYSQFNLPNGKQRPALANVDNPVFVFDESHNAAGERTKKKKVDGKWEQVNLRAGYLFDLIKDKPTVYLSATYAKRPDNTAIYHRTDMMDAVDTPEDLIAAVEAGGIPLQTILSGMLAESGQLFRRERSFKGISFNQKIISENMDKQVKDFNSLAEGLTSVDTADGVYQQLVYPGLAALAEEQGIQALQGGNRASDTVSMPNSFASILHNYSSQFTMAAKADLLVDQVLDAVKTKKDVKYLDGTVKNETQKAFIGLENTMEAGIKGIIEHHGLKAGDDFPYSFKDILINALNKTRYINIKDSNTNKITDRIEITLQQIRDIDPIAYQVYKRAEADIKNLDISDIPVSPIDYVLQKLNDEGVTTGEMTGRGYGVDYSGDVPKVKIFGKRNKNKTITKYNTGETDVILANTSGSTGFSIHASQKEEVTDKRQRHMFIVQAPKDINILVQMLGRINRTGQVVLPEYSMLSLNVPAETRAAIMTAKKMASLNANTSANEESDLSLKIPDFINKYGNGIANQFLLDNPDIAQRLKLASKLNEDVDITEGVPGKLMSQLTGKLILMDVATQEYVLDEMSTQYNELIDMLNANGTNDLIVQDVNLEAKITESRVIHEGKGTSIFDQDSVLHTVDANFVGNYLKGSTVQKALDKDQSEDVLKQVKQDDSFYNKLQTKLKNAREKEYKTNEAKEKAVEEIVSQINNYNTIQARTEALIESHKVGTLLMFANGDNGVITGVSHKHTEGKGNPYSPSKVKLKVAINNGIGVVNTSLSLVAGKSTPSSKSYDLDTLFVRPLSKKQERKVATGNLLMAITKLEGGKIVTFTDEKGTRHQGILMPKDSIVAENQTFKAEDANVLQKFLENGGRVTSNDNKIKVIIRKGYLNINLPSTDKSPIVKKVKYDKELRGLLGRDFAGKGSFMNVTVDENIPEIIKHLMSIASLNVPTSEREEWVSLGGKEEKQAKGKFDDTLESKVKPTKVVGEHPAFSFLGVGKPAGLSEQDILNIINKKYGRPLAGASKFKNLNIINNPNKKWRGQYNPRTKKMELNAYYLTEADTIRVLHHEKVHEHIRKDKELERIANNIIKRAKRFPNSPAGKAYEIAKDRTAHKKGKVKNYDSVVLEETLAYLVQYYNKPGNKSVLKPYIDAIRKFFSKYFSMFMNEDMAVDYINDMVATEVSQFKETGIPVLTKKVEPIDDYEAELLKNIEDSYESGLGDTVKGFANNFESDWFANTKSYTKRHLWGTLNVRQIAEILGKYAPVIKNKYIDRFKLYEADMNEMKQTAGEIANDRQKLPKQESEVLAETQHEATIEGFDPSIEEPDSMTGENNDMPRSPEEIARRRLIKNKYRTLTDAAKKVYKKERDYHNNMHNMRLEELKNRINDIEADEGFKELMIDKLTAEFSKAAKNGPYFPLARFGQFWVSSVNAAGEKSFDMFENETAQERFKEELRNTPGEDILGAGRQLDKLPEVSSGIDSKFIAEVDKLVSKAGGDDSLRDDIFQLYLESLPELSSRKKYLHRKKTKGFSRDQAKAFAHAARADANDIARIKHIHVLQDMIEQTEISLNIASSLTLKEEFTSHAAALQRALDETPFDITDEEITRLNKQAPFKTFRLQQTGDPEAEIKRILGKEKSLLRNANKIDETKITFVSNGLSELKASHEAMVNSNVHPIASGLNSLGFLWYLGASPAAALVNLTQTPVVALPMMLTDKALKGSAGHLTKAVADFMKGKGTIEPTLNAKEKEAFKFWHDSGLLENTQAHDLSGIADSGIDTGTFKNKAMRMISFMFHRAEVMNREVTALATYRAAIDGGMNHKDAMKKASDLTWDSHLDYGASNRARFMRGNFARVITQFKQYSQGITYIYARTAFQAFKGENKADRVQAQKLLGLLMSSQLAVAGTMGLPLAGIIMGMAQGLEDAFGDDDDPVSMKAEFRQAMSDFAGKAGGQAISHGLIDAFTPLSVSGRLSMSDLWLRTPDYDLEGKSEALAYIEALGGPMVGIFTNMFMAKQAFKRGDFLRGAESMTPKHIKDFIRAGRYAGEGNLTKAGLKIKDMTPAEIIAQGLGFSASEVSEIREMSTAIKNIERKRGTRRKDIIDGWIDGDDVSDEIKEWNTKHPRDRITGDTLRKAKRSKLRYARQVTKGVRETKRNRDLLGRYDY